MEEAIRNGTYVPPAPARTVDLNQKPVLYDVYLDGEGIVSVREHRRSVSEVESMETDLKAGKDMGTWGSMMVSVLLVQVFWFVVLTSGCAAQPLAAVTEKEDAPLVAEEVPPPAAVSPRPSHRAWIPRRLRARPRTSDVPMAILGGSTEPSSPGSEGNSESDSSPRLPEAESVQLALFIAMPTPLRHSHEYDHAEDDEEPLPSIEIGFTEVNIRTKGSGAEGEGGDEASNS